MYNQLQLAVSRDFNGVTFNCYVEQGQVDPTDFWATREQIGQALGYAEPRIAIANIHNRNKERLDKFSRVIKMITHEESRNVTREVTIYNFKGLLEICRYSNQPVANAVMDVLWDIADEIRRTGEYKTKTRRSPRSFMKDAELIIDKTFKCKTEADCQSVQALDKVFQSVYGYSVLDMAEIQPTAPCKSTDEALWQHIVATFDVDEWFSSGALYQTLDKPMSRRQLRRYLSGFVAVNKLHRRGNYKNSEYSR